MNRYKIVIKGNEKGFTVKTKGDINRILTSISQFICETCIKSEISKEEYLKICKKIYELTIKYLNEEK